MQFLNNFCRPSSEARPFSCELTNVAEPCELNYSMARNYNEPKAMMSFLLRLSILTSWHTDILRWDKPQPTWMSAISQNSTTNVLSLINCLPIWELTLLLWNPESPLATETHLATVVHHSEGYYSDCSRRLRDGSTHKQNIACFRYNTIVSEIVTISTPIAHTCITYVLEYVSMLYSSYQNVSWNCRIVFILGYIAIAGPFSSDKMILQNNTSDAWCLLWKSSHCIFDIVYYFTDVNL